MVLLIVEVVFLGAQVFVEGRDVGEGGAEVVVDDLGVDVLRGEAHAEARAFRRAFDVFADSPAAFLE